MSESTIKYVEILNFKRRAFINGDIFDNSNLELNVYYENGNIQNVKKDNIFINGKSGTFLISENFSTTDEFKDYSFNISFKDNNQTIQERQISCKVYPIKEIKSILIKDIYSNYHVSEKFLNKDDTTKVQIKYIHEVSEEEKTVEILLSDMLSLLNVSLEKEKKLTFNDNRTNVIVSYINNFNIRAEYTLYVTSNVSSMDSVLIDKYVVVYIGESSEENPTWKWYDKYLVIKDLVYNEELNNESFIGHNTSYINEEGIRELYFDSNYGSLDTFLNKLKELKYIIGYLTDINNPNVNSSVVLFEDYVPPIDGQSNISIKFPCYVEGNEDKINKCRFGILFGNNNAKNRLFLSGNEKYRNCDWHSGQISFSNIDLNVNGNFTYFEDMSYCFYGENDNKIVGYDIVSNDKLLVLKDHSDKETSVYFRTPLLVTAIDGGGNVKQSIDNSYLYQEEFSLVKGNSSVAGISNHAIKNLNGDTLFISNENQVVGLDIEGIIGDNQRYANTRSYYIDKYIKDKDLSNSWLWTNNKDLYLILEDEIFICNREMRINNQYEWFKVNIANVESIIEINNTKYYGTKDGKFYKENNEYTDIHRLFLEYGEDSLLVKEDYKIYIDRKYLSNINNDKKYYFKIKNNLVDNGIFQRIAIATDAPTVYPNEGILFIADKLNNRLRIEFRNEKSIIKWSKIFSPNKEIYFNNINIIYNSPSNQYPIIQAKKRYRLKEVESQMDGYTYYKIYDEDDNEMSASTINTANICYKLDDEYIICNINEEDSTFQLRLDDNEEIIIDIVDYDNDVKNNLLLAEIKEYNDVECYYITKPYYFGTLSYNKTIYGWVLSNDTGIENWLEITYANNKIPYKDFKTLMKINSDKLGIDFDILNFYKIDLDKNIVPRVSSNFRILPNVNFICFGFKNTGNTNSALCKMNITYSLSSPAYGKY